MNPKGKIKIIIADDHSLIREALDLLLKQNCNIDVIGQVNNGKALIGLIKTKRPDIVLLDIEMPVMNGCEALDIIVKRFPEVSVIIISMHNEMRLMADFIGKGAKSFLSKDCGAITLFEAINAVKNEGFYFDKRISVAILEGYLKEKSTNTKFSELSLTKREQEILTLLCDGKTNKQIADHLNITPSTVDFHRGRIYKKTKSNNLAGIVKYAVKNGLISAT